MTRNSNERHTNVLEMLYVALGVDLKKVLLSGSTLVPTTVRVTGSARLATQPPAECTASVTNTGKGKPATSLTVGTTAGAPTTATATSPARSCASATTVGKVRASSHHPIAFIDANNTRNTYFHEPIRVVSLSASGTLFHRATVRLQSF